MNTPATFAAAAQHAETTMAPNVRAALLYALWHHQGAGSPIGQPIRKALGLGPHHVLTAEELTVARGVRHLMAGWQ